MRYIGLHLAIAALGLTGCASRSAPGMNLPSFQANQRPGSAHRQGQGRPVAGEQMCSKREVVRSQLMFRLTHRSPLAAASMNLPSFQANQRPGSAHRQGQGRPVEGEQMCSRRDVVRSQLMFRLTHRSRCSTAQRGNANASRWSDWTRTSSARSRVAGNKRASALHRALPSHRHANGAGCQ
jgi:hypothetical protein